MLDFEQPYDGREVCPKSICHLGQRSDVLNGIRVTLRLRGASVDGKAQGNRLAY